eukprot:TRINITY_DN15035_c0_g1_i1.p1 TRINITY_DN15035_c0_g1~~TRINITY_DN15035_c0_g1_i1.p1  ORF type:complete len:360 (+),score=112.67 TRINITY_DN15035_c0_g1_i1:53-1132(+)
MASWARRACRFGLAAGGAGVAAAAWQPVACADGKTPVAAQFPIPLLGFGTACLGEKTTRSVLHALEIGYKHIDTALLYETHLGVAEALKQTEVPRDEIFLTTKVGFFPPGKPGLLGVPDGTWQAENGKGKEREGVELSLKELGVDCVDLCMVHTPLTSYLQMWTAYIPHFHCLRGWPRPITFMMECIGKTLIWLLEDPAKARAVRKETWQAMEQLVRDGKAKAIGVSNYEVHHMQELLEYATIKPAANQFECHPNFPREDLVDFCQKNGVAVVAYGSDRSVRPLSTVSAEAREFAPPLALVLRWTIERGICVIPRSGTPAHREENARVFGWSLNEQHKAAIAAGTLRNSPAYWNPIVVP